MWTSAQTQGIIFPTISLFTIYITLYHYISLYITVYHYISLYITISLFNFQQTFLSLDKGEIKATNVGMWKWIHWCPLKGINWEIPLFSEFKYFRPGRNKIEQCGIYTSCKNSIGKIGWYSVNELEKLIKSFSLSNFMKTFSLNYLWCFNPSPLLLCILNWLILLKARSPAPVIQASTTSWIWPAVRTSMS